MSRCRMSSTKYRVSTTGKGNPGNYKHGMRGCTWTKIMKDEIRIGRRCTKCNKEILNPRGI